MEAAASILQNDHHGRHPAMKEGYPSFHLAIQNKLYQMKKQIAIGVYRIFPDFYRHLFSFRKRKKIRSRRISASDLLF